MARLKPLTMALSGFCLVAATPASDRSEIGRAIFEDGNGTQPISATIGSPPVEIAPAARACALCHGSTGMGASEGGVAAPALVMTNETQAQTISDLAAALRKGRGRDGRQLLTAMPRYAISETDLDALARYSRTLPYPPQSGVTQTQISIGLDLTDSGFDASNRAMLRDHVTASLDRINAEGGIFGRKLMVVDAGTNAFITVSWTAAAPRYHIAITARISDEHTGPPPCGTLHGSLRQQIDWLTEWLQSKHLEAHVQGPLAPASVSPISRSSSVTVYVGPSDKVQIASPQPLYIFADLGTPRPGLLKRPNTYVVTSIDLESQMSAVKAMQNADPRLASSPRLASAAVELDRATALVIQALTRAGRRVTQRAVCNDLRAVAAADQRYTILDLSNDSVLAK